MFMEIRLYRREIMIMITQLWIGSKNTIPYFCTNMFPMIFIMEGIAIWGVLMIPLRTRRQRGQMLKIIRGILMSRQMKIMSVSN